MPVVNPADLDQDEWALMPIWKAKKWVSHILFQMFERYGLPTKVEDVTIAAFAAHFMDVWSIPVLQAIVQTLSSSSSGVY